MKPGRMYLPLADAYLEVADDETSWRLNLPGQHLSRSVWRPVEPPNVALEQRRRPEHPQEIYVTAGPNGSRGAPVEIELNDGQKPKIHVMGSFWATEWVGPRQMATVRFEGDKVSTLWRPLKYLR